MTPLHFEEIYGVEWHELDALLTQLRGGRRKHQAPVCGDRLAMLYRRACEQLALARARAYPAYIIEKLEHLTAEAHQVIYQRPELGLTRLKTLAALEFPRAVRAHALYVWVALVVFALPTLAIGVLVYARPELVLTVLDPESAAGYEQMYSKGTDSIGRRLSADNDWQMFGFYIRNNISVAFQCFASGLFAGLGSLIFLAINGALAGAVAGFVTERGLASTFYSFVATHSAFELTAIVLAGAAGLRIGHSLLAPGRRTRGHALIVAARESVVIIYGVIAMLLIAAGIEAFWSASSGVPPVGKYIAAATCWTAVLSYLTLQGRHAS